MTTLIWSFEFDSQEAIKTRSKDKLTLRKVHEAYGCWHSNVWYSYLCHQWPSEQLEPLQILVHFFPEGQPECNASGSILWLLKPQYVVNILLLQGLSQFF